MLNKELFDSTIAFYVDLERLGNKEAKTVLDLLKQMQKDLLASIATDRTERQLQESQAVIKRYYKDIANSSQSVADGVSTASANETAKALATATGQQFTAGLLPTNEVLKQVASDAIIEGAVQKDWWSKQAINTAFAFQGQVRQGIVNGENLSQIVDRVNGVMMTSRRNAEILVRTSISTVANNARIETYKANEDLIKGYEWVASLDFKTCLECGNRDNKQWTMDGKGINTDIPYITAPLHFGCRCTMIAVLKSSEELGIDLPALPARTRSSIEGTIEDTSFASWLKRRPPKNIEEVLGKGRAELWLNGKVTFEQLFKGGTALTLEELLNKYAN